MFLAGNAAVHQSLRKLLAERTIDINRVLQSVLLQAYEKISCSEHKV